MMMLFGRLNASLVKRYEPLVLLRFGMLMQTSFGVILFMLHKEASIALFFPFMGLYVGMLGYIFSIALSLSLEFSTTISASAYSFVGVLQYSTGALMGFIASSLHDGTLFPITAVMLLVSLSGTALLLFGSRGFITHHHKEL